MIAPTIAAASPVDSRAADHRAWRPATRLAFRLTFVYFGLYVLTTQMLGAFNVVPFWLHPQPLEQLPPMRNVVTWTAQHVFHVTRPIVVAASGSGDRTFNWVAAFCLFVIALLAAVAWTLVDRRRAEYRSLNKWFRVFVRFALATTMLSYGMQKALPLQMPYPPLQRLVEPFGNFSPMGVLWYSIGASPGYERFAGLMEVAAAVLLFAPGMTTLGAAVAFADTVQVLMLNLTYDVPVKLFAFHLLLLSIVLLAPDIPRLLNVFVFDRATVPSTQPPLATGRGARRLIAAAQIVLGIYYVGLHYTGASRAWARSGSAAPRPSLYGVWDVERMWVDGVERAPLVTDYDRWRRVIVSTGSGMTFQRMDESFVAYSARYDEKARAIALSKPADRTWKASLTYAQPRPGVLTVDGGIDGHAVRMELQLFDTNRFLLVSRGFSWVQEFPFNR